MKKLMIAAAIVCAAVVSQGASVYWKASLGYGQAINANAAGSVKFSGTGYIIQLTETITQQAVLDSLRGTGKITDFTAATTVTVGSDGKFATTPFTTDWSTFDAEGKPEGSATFFLALVKDDYVFLTKAGGGTPGADADSAKSISYTTTAPSKVFNGLSVDFSGNGGWYQTVPEPTSGLLLLLGVAGLALRRRRA